MGFHSPMQYCFNSNAVQFTSQKHNNWFTEKFKGQMGMHIAVEENVWPGIFFMSVIYASNGCLAKENISWRTC